MFSVAKIDFEVFGGLGISVLMKLHMKVMMSEIRINIAQ